MEISNRDAKIRTGSQAGQAILEYILVLVVTVAIILGGLYQLNTAFKVWAKGYFGDYIACLLETGELPDISGAPGDSGVCKTAFKEFSLADGGPGIAGKGGKKEGGAENPTASTRDGRRGGGGSAGGGGGGSRFSGGSRPPGSGSGNGGRRGASDSNYTGSNSAGNYGAGGGSGYRRQNTDTKERLDNRFAFDNESADKQKRRDVSSVAKSNGPDQGDGEKRAKMHRKEARGADQDGGDDKGMTFGNFIRWLIIAAIIIALVLLIGGQMLQVGKSME